MQETAYYTMNNESLSLRIGRVLKLVRESRNLKQEHIAAKLGYADKSTYARMEAGKIKHISVSRLNEACKTLDCNILHFFLLFAATSQFNHRINTWEEFIESLTGLPVDEKERMLELVRELFPARITNR